MATVMARRMKSFVNVQTTRACMYVSRYWTRCFDAVHTLHSGTSILGINYLPICRGSLATMYLLHIMKHDRTGLYCEILIIVKREFFLS